MVSIEKKKIRFIQMSLRFVGGALRLTGARKINFVMDPPVLPGAPVVEVPTTAPEVVAVVEVPVAAPEVPTAAPEPVPEPVVEVPTAAPEPPSEVEAPAEVAETAPEAGLVPENPPTE
jgi:hypothetical protein